MKTYILFVSLLCIAIVYGACGSGTSHNQESDNSNGSTKKTKTGSSIATGDVTAGKAIYGKYCVLCHGEDGKMQLNGSKDITVSQLSYDLRVTLIMEGKNLMTPFDGILSESEIRDVVAFSMTLKP